MISSKNSFSPRFAHDMWSMDRKTIAYVRDNDVVYFGFARVNPKDVYNKKIGREVSTEYLETAMKTLPLMTPYFADRFYFDPENQCGFMKFAGYVTYAGLDTVLADQLVANMGFMDIKHASICACLIDMSEGSNDE